MFSLRTLIAAGLTLACVGACTTEAEDHPVSSEDDLSESALRSAVVLKGSVQAGESITLDYKPSAYPGKPGVVPFLAVELLPPAESAAPTALGPQSANISTTSTLDVKLEGDFPGTPRLLVVDENFRVLASARAAQIDGLEQISVTVDGHGKKFVLVRDMLWVAPMNFQISTGL